MLYTSVCIKMEGSRCFFLLQFLGATEFLNETFEQHTERFCAGINLKDHQIHGLKDLSVSLDYALIHWEFLNLEYSEFSKRIDSSVKQRLLGRLQQVVPVVFQEIQNEDAIWSHVVSPLYSQCWQKNLHYLVGDIKSRTGLDQIDVVLPERYGVLQNFGKCFFADAVSYQEVQTVLLEYYQQAREAFRKLYRHRPIEKMNCNTLRVATKDPELRNDTFSYIQKCMLIAGEENFKYLWNLLVQEEDNKVLGLNVLQNRISIGEVNNLSWLIRFVQTLKLDNESEEIRRIESSILDRLKTTELDDGNTANLAFSLLTKRENCEKESVKTVFEGILRNPDLTDYVWIPLRRNFEAWKDKLFGKE